MGADTLDLHSRLKREFSFGYQKRTVERPKPRLFADITTNYAAPKPSHQPASSLGSQTAKPRPANRPTKKPLFERPTKTVKPALPRQTKSSLLMRNLVKPKAQAKKRKRLGKLQYATALAIVTILAAGGFLTYNGWKANQTVQAQAQALTAQANHAATSPNGNPALSTYKPNLTSYVVAPNMPRYLIIPKIYVKARIMPVGITSTGNLGVPNNVYDAAWYKESSLPGQAGAMVIDGHLDGYNVAGVFWNLHKLGVGDTVEVQLGSGKTFTYKVVKTKAYSVGHVDMQAAMTAINPKKPGLNLITCDGGLTKHYTYNQRLVVFTEQV